MKTITVETADHGEVTFPEPAWCTRGSHTPPPPTAGLDARPRRSELTHQGAPVNVTVTTPAGTEVLVELALWQDIFPDPNWSHGTRVYAVATLVSNDAVDLDVAGLDQLADAMYDAARQIRTFSNVLALQQPRDGGQ
ncbi:DUF6907 domain-containing protein [Streptomyces sp. NPDC020983]|uniref:DUF6907 domain-containing protein n=1 Tax=Streptomyces sp. NPDC020983 TaxID=3365106 RepID=UPI0037999B72